MEMRTANVGTRVKACVRGERFVFLVLGILAASRLEAQPLPVVPPDQRGSFQNERSGTHDAANIRTLFWNYGMVGDFPADANNVDLSVFHSVEVPA